jgi:hypothetical protein
MTGSRFTIAMRFLAQTLPLLAPGILAAAASADVVVLAAVKDNTLYEDLSGVHSNGKGNSMFSGITAQNLIRRALLRFDVAGAIPAGSTILSAELTLSMTMTISNAQDVSVHRALADWGESTSNAPGQEGSGGVSATGDATWIHTFFNGSFWAAPGGDYVLVPSATTSVAFGGDYVWAGPGVVADVQGWLDSPGTNFGWLVRHDDEVTAATAKRFATRENVDVTQRPSLEIIYEPPGSCAGTNYCLVNPNSTGNAAIISYSGSCSIAFNDFTLTAQPVPNQSFLFFFGPNQIQLPFGNGFLCVGGGLTRINPPMFASGNVATRSIDLVGLGLAPGTKNFQCWFRDPMGGGAAYNTSDAIQITLIP